MPQSWQVCLYPPGSGRRRRLHSCQGDSDPHVQAPKLLTLSLMGRQTWVRGHSWTLSGWVVEEEGCRRLQRSGLRLYPEETENHIRTSAR